MSAAKSVGPIDEQAALRQEADEAREELAATVSALAAKTDVKGRSKAKAQDVTDQTKAKAQDVTGQTRAKAQDVADQTKAKVQDLTGQTKAKAHDLTEQTTGTVRERPRVAIAVGAAAGIAVLGAVVAAKRRGGAW